MGRFDQKCHCTFGTVTVLFGFLNTWQNAMSETQLDDAMSVVLSYGATSAAVGLKTEKYVIN